MDRAALYMAGPSVAIALKAVFIRAVNEVAALALVTTGTSCEAATAFEKPTGSTGLLTIEKAAEFESLAGSDS